MEKSSPSIYRDVHGLCNPDLAPQQPVTCQSSHLQQIKNDLQQVPSLPRGPRQSLKQHPSSELPSGIHQTDGRVPRKSRAPRHATLARKIQL